MQASLEQTVELLSNPDSGGQLIFSIADFDWLFGSQFHLLVCWPRIVTNDQRRNQKTLTLRRQFPVTNYQPARPQAQVPTCRLSDKYQ